MVDHRRRDLRVAGRTLPSGRIRIMSTTLNGVRTAVVGTSVDQDDDVDAA